MPVRNSRSRINGLIFREVHQETSRLFGRRVRQSQEESRVGEAAGRLCHRPKPDKALGGPSWAANKPLILPKSPSFSYVHGLIMHDSFLSEIILSRLG